jgi:hypothetical protein
MSYGTAVLNQFTRRPGFRLLRTRSASAPRQRPGDGAEQRSTCKRGARDTSVGACLQPLCPVNEWHSDIFVDHRTYLKSAFAAVDLDVQHSMRLPLQGPRDERPDASPELHVASQALPRLLLRRTAAPPPFAGMNSAQKLNSPLAVRVLPRTGPLRPHRQPASTVRSIPPANLQVPPRLPLGTILLHRVIGDAVRDANR